MNLKMTPYKTHFKTLQFTTNTLKIIAKHQNSTQIRLFGVYHSLGYLIRHLL